MVKFTLLISWLISCVILLLQFLGRLEFNCYLHITKLNF